MRFWTTKEVAFLKEKADTHTVRELAKHLNRTIGAIYKKLDALGISGYMRKYHQWKTGEVKQLIHLHDNEKCTFKEIAERLGVSRKTGEEFYAKAKKEIR